MADDKKITLRREVQTLLASKKVALSLAAKGEGVSLQSEAGNTMDGRTFTCHPEQKDEFHVMEPRGTLDHNHMLDIYEELKSAKDLTLIGITLQDTSGEVNAFIDNHCANKPKGQSR